MLELVRKTGNREKGFTLVELLIVIAIIAILASIAIPQFSQYRQKAAAANAMAEIANCVQTLNAQYADAGTPTTLTCSVGTSSATLTLNTGLGTVSGIDGSYTVKGLTVTCALTSNQVSCT
jgi:type IV pilus assembly protein PilA